MKTLHFKILIITLTLSSAIFQLSAQNLSFTFKNKGAYDAKFTLSWNNGTWDTGKLMAGQSATFSLSSDARNIRVKAEKSLAGWRKIHEQAVSSGGTMTTTGTAFKTNARWVPERSDIVASRGTYTEKVENVNAINGAGDSKLHLAVRGKDTEEIKRLFRMGITVLDRKNNRGFTPIHEAIQVGDSSIVQILIHEGPNLDMVDNMNKTPLDLAIERSEAGMVSMLIHGGADVRKSKKAFERLIQRKDTDIAILLLDAGADTDLAIQKAIDFNDQVLFELLLSRYNVLPSDELFKTTISKRRFEFAKVLLANGVDPNKALTAVLENRALNLIPDVMQAGAQVDPLIEYGVQNNNLNIVETAVGQHGGDPNTYFPLALEKNNMQIINYLLEANANPAQAMDVAIQQNNTSFVKVLLEKGAVANDYLNIAIDKNQETIIKELILKGADPNIGLEYAMKKRSYSIAQIMVEAGAYADAYQVVETAVSEKQINLLKAALNGGADPNPGMSLAIKRNDTDYAKLLLQANADASQENYIQQATQNNNTSLVNALLEKGADPNKGLAMAVQNRNINLMKSFLEKGANPEGFDLVKLAVQEKNSSLLGVVLNAGAKPDPGMAIAIDRDDTEFVKILLEANADASPIEYIQKAAQSKNKTMITVLLDSGADPDAGLSIVAEQKEADLIELFLEKGANAEGLEVVSLAVQEKNISLLRTALMAGANPNPGMAIAIDRDDTEYVKILLEANADPTPPEFIKKATESKNISLITALLEKGADPNYGMPIAIRQNDANLVNIFLQSNADVQDQEYMSSAAKAENMSIVTSLLENGASPEPAMPIAFASNNTSLAMALINSGAQVSNPEYLKAATFHKNLNLIDALLSKQADPNPGMHPAIQLGNTQIVSKLIESGADAGSPEYMSSAAKQGNLELVTILLDNHANPDPGMPQAVEGEFIDIVRLLLSHGADGSPVQFIQMACERENLPLVETLISGNANPNAGMEIAVTKNNTSLVQILLSAGADGSFSGFMNKASANGNLKLVQMLMEAGGDPNAGIYAAVKGNFADIAQLLIEQGAEASSSSLIISSAEHNNPMLTSLLIDAGADPGEALVPAVKNNADKIIRLVKEHGIDITDPELLGQSVKANFTEATRELLEGGIDPNAWNEASSGYSLLHLACTEGNLEIITMLVVHGAKVNSATISKITPLHLLVAQGKDCLEHAELLIAAGADVNARDVSGEIVFQKARSLKIKRLLKDHGAIKK